MKSLRSGVVLALALSFSGCVSGQRRVEQQAIAPAFDPAAFFSGHTHGEATLKIALHRPERVAVDGQGRLAGDGTLILDQSVRTADAPAKQRSWRLHPVRAGQWIGTLSDAAGPVAGEIIGNCLHLAFTMRRGLKVQQWLYLQPGGTTVHNVMVVRKLGAAVARLDETITHQP